MITEDEIREIVLSEYKKANYDRNMALVAIKKLCNENEELTMAFAKYGAIILRALIEKKTQTLQ